MTQVVEKPTEYEAKGIRNIWVIDPRLQLVSVFTRSALVPIQGDSVRAEQPDVELTRAEIFPGLRDAGSSSLKLMVTLPPVFAG